VVSHRLPILRVWRVATAPTLSLPWTRRRSHNSTLGSRHGRRENRSTTNATKTKHNGLLAAGRWRNYIQDPPSVRRGKGITHQSSREGTSQQTAA